MSNEILKQAYQRIRDGNKADAIKLLMPLLKADRDNKNGWWLLANAASKPEQIEFALKNVLRLDPHHAKAQAKLDQLQANSAADFFSTVSDSPPSSVESSTLSYFGTSSSEQPASENTAWNNDDDDMPPLAAFDLRPSPKPSTAMPVKPRIATSKSSEGLTSGMMVMIFSAILVAAFCVIGGVVYQSGAFDSLLDTEEANPAPTPLDGWKVFSNDGMEVQVPSAWFALNLDQDIDDILDAARQSYPHMTSQIELMRRNPNLFKLMATAPSPSVVGFQSNLVVTQERLPRSMDLEGYIELSLNNLPSSFNPSRFPDEKVGPYNAGILEMRQVLSGINIRQRAYIIVENNRAWVLTYSADARTFFEFEAVFAHSAQTFRIR